MKRVFVAMTSLLLMAQAPSKQFWQIGAGNWSCAKAFENSETEQMSLEWALGYLSGRNQEATAMVGSQTDIGGIVDDIKLYCRTHPSNLFGIGVDDTYMKLGGH